MPYPPPPFRPAPGPYPTPTPPGPGTLEHLWEQALAHMDDAAAELAAAETDWREGRNGNPALARQADWRLGIAGTNAMIGHGYAAMAQAAATGLAATDADARQRWQDLAGFSGEQ